MKQGSGNLILLRAGFVVPLKQDIVGIKQFYDGSDKIARLGAYPVTGIEISHTAERNTARASSKNAAVAL